MLLPDVREVIDDPELGGGEPFTVVREVRKRTLTAGQNETVTRTRINLTGNIQPASTEDLQRLKEEEQSERVIVIRSLFQFSLGEDSGSGYTAPDLVIYLGEVYKITRVDQWTQWGFNTAYAAQQKGMSASELLA